MPLARKNKIVSLTEVKPKTKDHKQSIVNKVHLYLDKFKFVYILSYENMTTNNFKQLKQQMIDSKFLMGKNKVIGVAFGHDQQSSYKSNLFKLTPLLKGHKSLLFTNKSQEDCKIIFNNFEQPQFATGGAIASYTIILEKGFNSLQQFSYSLEPRLRQLTLPTRLINSKIQLMNDYCVCQEGKPISVEKCKILKLLGIKMSRLKFSIDAIYSAKKLTVYK